MSLAPHEKDPDVMMQEFEYKEADAELPTLGSPRKEKNKQKWIAMNKKRDEEVKQK